MGERRAAPTFTREREYTAIQKVALVMWHICSGEGMRTCDVATLTGSGWKSAKRMMNLISAVIPEIDQDEKGVWCAYPYEGKA